MNKKRVIALLAAATMLFSTVPVFATTSATEVTTPGAVTVTGRATVNDVDKDKPLKVTLPTKNALAFTVDPHNLVGLASGESSVISTSATGQGAILPSNTLAVIKNMSNVDVKVDVTLSLVNTATGSSVNLVTDQAAVASGTGANMLLAAVPSTQKAWDDTTYVATNQAFAVDTSGTQISYKLGAAEYEVVSTASGFTYQYDADAENNFDAVAFKLGGSVNKAADWAPFVDKLQISAVFDVEKATDSDTLATGSSVYDLASGSAATVNYTPVVAGNNTTTAKPTEAYVAYNNSKQYFWCAVNSTTPFASGASLTNAKVNGSSVTATLNSAGYVLFNWSDLKTSYPTAPWKFTFEIDGVAYTATYN